MKSISEIIAEIQEDIDNGMYLNFPKLLSRLTYIKDKLIKSKYIINAEYRLSRGELETLVENTYIEKEDIEYYLKQ
jgi:hypothetical protein